MCEIPIYIDYNMILAPPSGQFMINQICFANILTIGYSKKRFQPRLIIQPLGNSSIKNVDPGEPLRNMLIHICFDSISHFKFILHEI